MDDDRHKHLAYEDYPKEPVELATMSVEFMREAVFVPLTLNHNTLVVAVSHPDGLSRGDHLQL